MSEREDVGPDAGRSRLRASPVPRARRGFTLVEVILATVLFALLMSSYYQVFTGVLELEEYARNQRSFASVGPAILDLIEDDLVSLHRDPNAADAFPFRGNDDSLGGQPADSLDFVARRRSVHQEQVYGDNTWVRSPICEVGYRLTRSSLAGRNVRKLYRRESYYPDSLPTKGGEYFEIYDRVVAFDVTYVGYRVEEDARADVDTDNQLEKFESWDSEQRRGYPTAVIVTLTIEPPELNFVGKSSGIDDARPQRTFVRVIPLPQAQDVDRPEESGDTPAPGPGTGG